MECWIGNKVQCQHYIKLIWMILYPIDSGLKPCCCTIWHSDPSSLHFTFIPSVYKFIAVAKSSLRNALLPAFLWVSAVTEIKIQKESWVLPVSKLVKTRSRIKLQNVAWHTKCSVDPLQVKTLVNEPAFCLQFTYMCNQEILGCFLNRPLLLRLRHLPVLKDFRVPW